MRRGCSVPKDQAESDLQQALRQGQGREEGHRGWTGRDYWRKACASETQWGLQGGWGLSWRSSPETYATSDHVGSGLAELAEPNQFDGLEAQNENWDTV